MTKPQKPNSVFPRPCRRCGIVKDESGFTTYPYRGQRYHRSFCKDCMLEYDRKRVRTKYSDLSAEEKKMHCASTMRSRKKRAAKGFCCFCGSKPATDELKSCGDCRQIRRAQHAKDYIKLRQTVLDAYGHNCSCCPAWTHHPDEFLTIEHVNGWGKDHRIASGSRVSGMTLFRWIIKNNFPDSIAIHCYNCNCSKGHQGYCPHESERESQLILDCPFVVSPIPDTLVAFVSDGTATVAPLQIN